MALSVFWVDGGGQRDEVISKYMLQPFKREPVFQILSYPPNSLEIGKMVKNV